MYLLILKSSASNGMLFKKVIPLAFISPRIRANKRIGPLSKKVLSILVGSLLGDAH
jgi:hypothetical protein